MSEGYVKFNCKLIGKHNITENELSDLIFLRDLLFGKHLIGAESNGVGFGNISKRYDNGRIVITATKTGVYEKLNAEHFAVIEKYNIINNSVECSGLSDASSETMTHLSIYGVCSKIQFVAHIHNINIWQKLINENLCTQGKNDYGTVGIALEAEDYVRHLSKSNGIFALSGHNAGIMVFAESPEEIMQLIYQNI